MRSHEYKHESFMPSLAAIRGAMNLILLPVLLWAATGWSGNPTAEDSLKWQQILKMYADYKASLFPDLPDVSVSRFLQWKDKDSLVLVDVRSTREQKVSMIPGAITREAFEKDADRFKKFHIVVYCTIGYRSGIYAQKLRRQGFQAYNLIAGVLGWAHAGQKFSSVTGDSLTVHVYGKEWNLLPAGYRAVW